jgi:MFS family permease
LNSTVVTQVDEHPIVGSRWADVPFAPRRFPIFYGWVMVLGSVMAVLASIPGQTVGVGVFTDHLIQAWGLSRVQLSTAYLFGTLISGFLLPAAGRVMDRIGTRIMIVAASSGLGMSMLVLAYADRAVTWAGIQSVLIAMIATTFCFLCLRFFGQGCLSIVSRVVIGKWFNRRRGMATAVAGILTSFGFNGSPVILNNLIVAAGWRGACMYLALGIGLGVSILGWLFFRDSPEECGLEMDGDAPVTVEVRAAISREHDFTRREALRTWAFWVFSLALAAHGLIITAMTFHVASIGAEMGLSREDSFQIFFPMSFFAVATTLLAGVVADRINLKYLLILFLIGEAVGTTGLMNLGDAWGRWMMYSGFGTAGGLFLPLITVAWPRFFGRVHLGAITGLNTTIMVWASAVGPVLFSQVQSLTGGYLPIIAAFWCVPIILLLAAVFADNPQSKFRTPDTSAA